MADANADGSLDFDEFCQLARSREAERAPSEDELRARFDALDADGSGKVDMHEYLRFVLRDALGQQVSQLCALFQEWDSDGSGTVDRREFRRGVRALLPSASDDFSDAVIDECFVDFDTDGNGAIARSELELLLRKYMGLSVEQRIKLRTAAGGRKGAAFATSVALDRQSGVPVQQQLCDAMQANLVRIIDVFRDWDESADGKVDRSEFVAAMGSLISGASQAELEALFKVFDLDGSGTIEYSELKTLLRGVPSRRARRVPSASSLRLAGSASTGTLKRSSSVATIRSDGRPDGSTPLVYEPELHRAGTSSFVSWGNWDLSQSNFSRSNTSPLMWAKKIWPITDMDIYAARWCQPRRRYGYTHSKPSTRAFRTPQEWQALTKPQAAVSAVARARPPLPHPAHAQRPPPANFQASADRQPPPIGATGMAALPRRPSPSVAPAAGAAARCRTSASASLLTGTTATPAGHRASPAPRCS